MARGNAKSPEIRKSYTGKKLSEFYEKVRARRLALGLGQSELAERTGLKQSQISAIEGGRFPNDPDRVAIIARALETTPNYLFGFEDEA